MKTYVITSGVYDGYRTVAHVVGPDRPALSTLKNKFFEELGVAPNRPAVTDYEKWERHVDDTSAALDKYRKKHPACAKSNVVETFVHWLKCNHNFQDADVPEVWVLS